MAGIGSLALLAPALEWITAVLFAGIAGTIAGWARLGQQNVARSSNDDLDRVHVAVLGFALAVTALAILATVPGFGYPTSVFVLTVFIVGFGTLGAAISRQHVTGVISDVPGFVFAGAVAGALGIGILRIFSIPVPDLSTSLFLTTTGALIGGLCRFEFHARDHPVTLMTVGLLLWVFIEVGVTSSLQFVTLALVVTAGLGIIAYLTGSASIGGMLSGVILGYVTVVFGGWGWFALLFAFFSIGALATKYRLDEKRVRGVAEANRGARGTGNVLGNSIVALGVVVGYAAAPQVEWFSGELLYLVFAGALATALADTLSSEIGTLDEHPRLITSFDQVPPGTNGAVSITGTLAGVAGAVVIGGIALTLGGSTNPIVLGVIVIAGVAGMFADSLLGATLEEVVLGNEGVNLLATLVGAVIALLLGIGIGLH